MTSGSEVFTKCIRAKFPGTKGTLTKNPITAGLVPRQNPSQCKGAHYTRKRAKQEKAWKAPTFADPFVPPQSRLRPLDYLMN